MKQDPANPNPSRRRFLAAATGVAAGALIDSRKSPAAPVPPTTDTEPFFGKTQSGILTPAQSQTYFATFDLAPTAKREDLIQVLKDWTRAADRMSRGLPTDKLETDPAYPTADSGEASGLSSARLTITFGFGPTLFTKDGHDRFGIAARRPAELVDLPTFHGDQLAPERTGGDVSIQACSDDPQVAFHAVRQLGRLADGIALLRWVQSGFIAQTKPDENPRNLMGFRDGSNNPSAADPKLMNQFVIAGDDAPDWMRGGSYVVVRKIRVALEHWDRMNIAFQEQTIGRHKASAAPLGGKTETEPANFTANNADGDPVIPENAHIRLAGPDNNDGQRILRRSYSYNDGVSFTSERWPPWRQGMEYDAGLFFVAYQRDPRAGFIKIFQSMARMDMLNQFTTHIGSGIFACPGGVAEGEFIGQRLFTGL